MLHRTTTLIIGLVLLAMLATACRDSGTPGSGEQAAVPPTGSPDAGTDVGDIATGVGVSSESCPDAVNEDNGCIYLGSLSDLTGPVASLGSTVTEAQEKFWERVNEAGGIGGYDIDVTTYLRDHTYNPQTANEVYEEVKGEVLALAQVLGSPTAAAIIEDMKSSQIVGAGASWSSKWNFEDNMLAVGSNLCYMGMNMVDYAVDELGAESVMSVHYPGEAGDDAAAGAKTAAEHRGMQFTAVPTQAGPSNQSGAIDEIVSQGPEAVVLTMAVADATEIVGQASARGYDGKFFGINTSWGRGMLDSPAAEAIKKMYLVSDVYPPFDSDTPGHNAMREALGDVAPDPGYVWGWVWSYPLKAVLERAVDGGALTRDAVLRAATSLESVDYEGMLPDEAGNQNEMFRETLLMKPDENTPTGLSVVQSLAAGPTASTTTIERPCFEEAPTPSAP